MHHLILNLILIFFFYNNNEKLIFQKDPSQDTLEDNAFSYLFDNDILSYVFSVGQKRVNL